MMMMMMMRRSLANAPRILLGIYLILGHLLPTARAFGLDLPSHLLATTTGTPPAAGLSDAFAWIATSPPASVLHNLNPASLYMDTLTAYPLPTKMVTGATLAVAGDAIAQAHEAQPHVYDPRRAASFAAFDMAYRALQHIAYPPIVNHFHGQYMGTAASLLFFQYYLPLDFGAALERTLTSQLGIVPFIYYPVFFTLTAYMQGLDLESGVKRAKDMFVPLMERNLLFWIPVQMIQFSLIPEDLQIPFVSVMGLFWTFALSVMAGSAKEVKEEEEEEEQQQQSATPTYCVIGNEEGCVVPDDLFPHTTLQDISEELTHEVEVVADVLSHEVEVVTDVITHEVEVVADVITHELEEISHAIFDHEDENNANGVEKNEVEMKTEEEREEIYK